MQIVSVINQKGGVGKSTTAIALSLGLAKEGYRVLCIDLDGQGNLTYALGAEPSAYGAMGVLERPETIYNEIIHLQAIDLIPSNDRLFLAQNVLIETGKEYRLKEALGNLKPRSYDYVVIDTPPSLGVLTINALSASNEVVIPSRADTFSLQGIGQLAVTINAIKKYCNPHLRINGILLTQYNARTNLAKTLSEQTEGFARSLNTRVYSTRIRECIAIRESQAMRKDIYTYSPTSNCVEDYNAFVREFLAKE